LITSLLQVVQAVVVVVVVLEVIEQAQVHLVAVLQQKVSYL
jgi:hypothetical protein